MKTAFSSKSFKYLGVKLENQTSPNQQSSTNSLFNSKINLLRVPVYDKKKKFKKIYEKRQAIHPETAMNLERSLLKKKCKVSQNNSKHQRYSSVVSCRQKQKIFRNTGLYQERKQTQQSHLIDIVRTQSKIQKQISCFNDANLKMGCKENSKINNPNTSQSLLKKNSLFLINFMKRKEKMDDGNNKQKPHIAGLENVATHMQIEASTRKSIKYIPKAEKRKMVTNKQKIVSNLSKILNSMAIEPW